MELREPAAFPDGLAPSVIAEQIRELGVSEGSTVLVHASLRVMGPIRCGGEGLLQGLQMAIGPSGAIMVVSFSFASMDPACWWNPPKPEDLEERRREILPFTIDAPITSGSEGGPEKPTSRVWRRALRSDPLRQGRVGERQGGVAGRARRHPSDGRKEVLAVRCGHRESTESWLNVLRDLRDRPDIKSRPLGNLGQIGFHNENSGAPYNLRDQGAPRVRSMSPLKT